MKKTLALLLLFPFLFAACSSDDDDEKWGGDVVGTWEYRSMKAVKIKTKDKDVTKGLKEYFNNIDKYFTITDVTTFGADGTMTSTGGLVSLYSGVESQALEGVEAAVRSSIESRGGLNPDGGTYTINGENLVVVEDATGERSVYKYRATGKELYLEYDGTRLFKVGLEEGGVNPALVEQIVLGVTYVLR